MLQILYNKKFLILTRDIMEYDCNNYFNGWGNKRFKSLVNIERECYEKIIREKLDDIFLGRNLNLRRLLGLYTRPGLKLLSQMYKDKKEGYLFENILDSSLKLAFLLSFDSFETLQSFLKNYKSDKLFFELELDFEDDIFKWNGSIPYETFCRLALCQGIRNGNLFYEFL